MFSGRGEHKFSRVVVMHALQAGLLLQKSTQSHQSMGAVMGAALGVQLLALWQPCQHSVAAAGLDGPKRRFMWHVCMHAALFFCTKASQALLCKLMQFSPPTQASLPLSTSSLT